MDILKKSYTKFIKLSRHPYGRLYSAYYMEIFGGTQQILEHHTFKNVKTAIRWANAKWNNLNLKPWE